MYWKINAWTVRLLTVITFVLFFQSIVNADEADKDPKVAKETTKEKDKTPRVTNVITKVKGQCKLFESITIEVDNLSELLTKADNNLENIILYFDGYPLSALHPRSGCDTAKELIFDLIMIEDSETAQTQNSWNSLLGKPNLFPPKPRKISITIGIENQPPIDTVYCGGKTFDLVTIDVLGFLIYLGMLVAAIVLFVWLAIKSDLLRDAGPQPEGKDINGKPFRKTFSLGRTQMAFWFLLVIASYVFIWMVTDVYSILTPSVLTLIGISTATAMSTTVIDGNKRNSALKKLETLNREMDKLNKEINSLNLEIGKKPAQEKLDILKKELDGKNVELVRLVAKIGNLEKTVKPLASESFFEDILSDMNGISFHRFQIAGWTLVLGVIFIASVYRVLSMPDFDSQLLTLMGISSGTYIGFKFPEKQV